MAMMMVQISIFFDKHAFVTNVTEGMTQKEVPALHFGFGDNVIKFSS